jgi:tetratricopeptide (TPR) repeat protein
VRDFTRPDEDAARRHRDHYLELAEEIGRNMVGPGLPVWLQRGRLEHENLIAALRWSLDRGDEQAVRMAGALGWYFFRSGFLTEGRKLIEEALVLAPGDPRALAGRAWITVGSGAADWLEVANEAIDACQEPSLRAEAFAARAQALIAAGQLEAAHADIAESRSACLASAYEEGLIFVDHMLGQLLLRAGDLDRAETHLLTAHDGLRRMRGTRYAGFTLIDLARVKLAQQQPHEALTLAAQAREDFARREDPRGLAASAICAGRARLMLGETEPARRQLDEARALCDRWGFPGLASEIPA